MKLSIPQLIGVAQNAGFSGPDLQTAVAIALAESGGDPNAYNPERAAGAVQGHGSFGLWQIYLTAHPEFSGQNLFDPNINAAAAYSVYAAAGNSFRPWSTFKNGAYLAHMDPVAQVILVSSEQPAGESPEIVSGELGPAPEGTDGSNEPGGGNDLLILLAFGGLLFFILTSHLRG
jgi:hypothetical protein